MLELSWTWRSWEEFGGGSFMAPGARVPQSHGGRLQPGRPCFDDPEDLHPIPLHKTATCLSFLPPRLYDLEWKGCLSYVLCLGQKENKNAIQPHHVRDVKEDCLPRMCGEFRGGLTREEVHQCVCVCVCVSSCLCATRVWFSSNRHYIQLNCRINQANTTRVHKSNICAGNQQLY